MEMRAPEWAGSRGVRRARRGEGTQLASHRPPPPAEGVFLVLRRWSAVCHSPLTPNSPLEMLLNLNPSAQIPTNTPVTTPIPFLNTNIVISWLHTHRVNPLSLEAFPEERHPRVRPRNHKQPHTLKEHGSSEERQAGKRSQRAGEQVQLEEHKPSSKERGSWRALPRGGGTFLGRVFKDE